MFVFPLLPLVLRPLLSNLCLAEGDRVMVSVTLSG